MSIISLFEWLSYCEVSYYPIFTVLYMWGHIMCLRAVLQHIVTIFLSQNRNRGCKSIHSKKSSKYQKTSLKAGLTKTEKILNWVHWFQFNIFGILIVDLLNWQGESSLKMVRHDFLWHKSINVVVTWTSSSFTNNPIVLITISARV